MRGNKERKLVKLQGLPECLMQGEYACRVSQTRWPCGVKTEWSMESEQRNICFFSIPSSKPFLSIPPPHPFLLMFTVFGVMCAGILCKYEEGFNFNLGTHQNSVPFWILLTGFASKQSAERNKRSHLNVQAQITLGGGGHMAPVVIVSQS